MRNLQIRTYSSAVAALAALVISCGAAHGAAFSISAVDAPGPFHVFANDFEFGLAINGNPFQQGLFNPASGDFPGGTVSFNGQFIDNGDTPPSTRTVYFVDPVSPTTAVDIFTYTFTPAGDFQSVIMNGSLTSDPSGLGPIPGGTDPANIWPAGVDFTWATTGFGGVIHTSVPAPGAAGLLALGGLMATRRRRAR